MRVLLDEHLPVRLAKALPEHEVSTVRKEGWAGLKNGALLSAAAGTGFAVLLTNDRSMEYQQDLRKVAIAVVVLDAPSNKIEDLKPLIPATLEAIKSCMPGLVQHVRIGST